ncbi:unnamed protein product [Chironomus riparius]|uniref:BESS domain-containing protein n=1 Tax=Chironomus riparius TaxID=315576 RepID=A0A9N9RKJ8_9DIPT|nr:unnamed protein product [Chironomus riparius]
MYQVTASQTEQNIKLISCVKQHRCLFDHSDQNYKNSVHVDRSWSSVSKDFGESISDCKKKWRHLRSSLSRYLKSSKDQAKNKNNKLKPYYLLQHMDFLVPYTKTLEMKSESVITKYESTDEQETFTEMKEDPSAYDHEIIQESQSMDDEEDIVYEAYEIQEQIPTSSTAVTPNCDRKSQITLVRSSHTNNQQNASIPQLQPLINTMSTPPKSSPQTLQLNAAQISQITQQQQQQQQQSQAQSVNMHQQQQSMPVQNTIIPISDDQGSADLNFFLALLPDVRNMNQDQKRRLRIGTLKLIDEILNASH